MKYLVAVAAAAILVPTAASAETPADAAWLDAGVFFAHIDSNLRLGNKQLDIPGTDIDLESDLGLDSTKTMPKINGGIRFFKRFRLEGDFFQLSRSGHLDITHEIDIDDTVFPIHADVDSHFRTNINRVALGYSFVRNAKSEFGASIGAHVTSARFRIEALNGDLEEHRSKSAPLPNVGLYGTVNLTGPLWLQGHADAFKMKVGKWKGSLIDAQLAVNYRFAKNFGAGIGYRYAHYKVSADTSSWFGTLWYTYNGPVAFLELAL